MTNDTAQSLSMAQMDTLPEVGWTWVNPHTAQEWLGENNGNRRKRPRHVDSLARDLENDRFMITGDTIKFDSDGRLIDGQHRLSAIIRSGVPMWMLVVTRLDPEVQSVIDANARRSARDALYFYGVPKNRNITAGLINIALTRENGGMTTALSEGSRRGNTNSEVLAWIEDNPDALDAVELAERTFRHIGCYPSILAYAAMILSRIDAEDAEEFLVSTAEKRTNGRGDPRLALLNGLARPEVKGGSTANTQQLFMIFRAWNAWRRGEELTRMTVVSRTGPREIPEPV